MAVSVRYYTDPASPESWNLEPVVRRLMAEFAGGLSWTYVMGGLARDYTKEPGHSGAVARWLEAADRGRMPLDPRLWLEGPISSTYPACMAVKAASEQAGDGGYAYLRALREGLFCFRRKLDTTEALVEEARRVRLDVERFRLDLGSNAIVEAFGNDLEEVRAGAEPIELPSIVFVGEAGSRHAVWGARPYEDYRAAADAAGAVPVDAPRPGVEEALLRFGAMATVEVEAVCGLPGPRASAELWRLASEWRVKPVRVLTGELWEPA
jgi:predicted DsbA family dithiol-disulfide isomerase